MSESEPLPHTPSRPGIGRRRRYQLAQAWLDRLGLEADPARVEALAPAVGRYRRSTVMGRIADTILTEGGVPDQRSVEERFLAMPGAPPRPSIFPNALTHAQATDVARWVHYYRATHGAGPLWKEVGAAFGWQRPDTNWIINDLRHRGYLAYTRATRSLTARPDGATYPAPCPPPPPRDAPKKRAPEQVADRPRPADLHGTDSR